MNRLIYTIFAVAVTAFFAESCRASSLDELYRDIIRSDNRGYLPLFVKNRTAPDDLLLTEEDLAGVAEIPSTSVDQWLKTIAAIKSNQVTPLELNDITARVKENDPKATEILAWMYAKGVGVAKDFVAAFNLYKKAAALNVANAEENALTVYKSMSEEQRRKVKNIR